MLKSKINYDESYWPPKEKAEATIQFKDFFGEEGDAFDRFVAEALISVPPSSYLNFEEDYPEFTLALWDVGGDTMTYDVDLSEMVKKVRCDKMHPDDAKSIYNNLIKMENAVSNAKQKILKANPELTEETV